MKNSAILSTIVLVIGAALGAYLMGSMKDKKQAEAVAAAVATERTARAAVETELASMKLDKEMADFRLRLGTISIEAARLNYGTAKDQALAFFTDLTAFAERAKGSPHEAKIAAILEKRDQIVSDISVGSPTAAETLQRMFLELD